MGSYRGPVQIRNDKSRPPSSARGHPARASKHRARCRRNSSVGEFTILPGNIDVENPAIVDHVLSLSLSLSIAKGSHFSTSMLVYQKVRLGQLGRRELKPLRNPGTLAKCTSGASVILTQLIWFVRNRASGNYIGDYGGFHKWEYPQKLVYNGKSH